MVQAATIVMGLIHFLLDLKVTAVPFHNWLFLVKTCSIVEMMSKATIVLVNPYPQGLEALTSTPSLSTPRKKQAHLVCVQKLELHFHVSMQLSQHLLCKARKIKKPHFLARRCSPEARFLQQISRQHCQKMPLQVTVIARDLSV